MFVPLSTTAVSVAVNSTTPQLFPCSGTTCTGTFSAPAGGTVNLMFAALDTQQRTLAEDAFAQAIAVNGVNALNVTLEAVVDHAVLRPSPPGLVSYQSGSTTVSGTAYDADNDVITGTYFAPLVLSVSGDTSGTLTVPTATLTSSSSTDTVAYAFAGSMLYVENHVLLQATSTTETAPSTLPFEVGRTFYTFTSANAIVGFAPGSTTPTRTVTMPEFGSVADLTCDGSNLYLADSSEGAIYGLGPTATSPVTYTSLLSGPDWVGANGGRAPSTNAQMYVGNSQSPGGIVGFQGTTSAPPFRYRPIQPSLPSAARAVRRSLWTPPETSFRPSADRLVRAAVIERALRTWRRCSGRPTTPIPDRPISSRSMRRFRRRVFRFRHTARPPTSPRSMNTITTRERRPTFRRIATTPGSSPTRSDAFIRASS